MSMAQVKFTTVISSKEIGRNDLVQVEFVVENAQQIEHLVPPNFSEFQVVQGPIQSSGMSVVNGSMTQYKALSFILQPVKAGKFTIPGATAMVDGKLMHSNRVAIDVSKASSVTPIPNTQPTARSIWPGEQEDVDREYFIKPNEDINEKIRKNLFVKVDVSKTDCYVGEPIVATYKLYSRLQSESRVVRHPSLNGFSVYDMIDPNNDAASIETINGKPFTVHIIRKAQLIPLQSGKVDLDPVEIDNTVHFLKNEKGKNKSSGSPLRDLFDDLLDENARATPIDQKVTLESKPVAISIKPLPDLNKPADFSGAVGHYSIKADVETKNVTADDAAVFRVTLKGSGNIPVVNAPAVPWPDGVETYDPTTKEEIDKTIAPIGGSKTFDYNFIPKKAGDYTIPAFQFSYFDPQSNSYKTTSTEPVTFSAKASRKKTSPKYVAPPLVSTDNQNGTLYFLKNHLEWVFAVMILAGLATFLLVQNRKLRQARLAEQEAALLAREAELARLAQLSAIPEDPLLYSKQLLNNGDYKSFYTELNRAIWKILSNRLKMPASELNKHNVIMHLQEAGWSVENTNLLNSTLNECEMKLYTPDYNEADIQRILLRAEKIVDLVG
ncbi:MAG: hypothetical protein C5B59_21085 [Bacteroidetes bacterium]|nr:MAG: hypothetical protein C5B59_21085 [Bacteroidota bacterium]